MATLASPYAGFADHKKMTLDEAGTRIARVINLMSKLNATGKDMFSMECNMGQFHRFTQEQALPTGVWETLYGGVPHSKGQLAQVDDTTGSYAQSCAVDTRDPLYRTNREALMMQKAQRHLESIAQVVDTSLFYQDTATVPESCKGLAARFNKHGTDGLYRQVIHGGGSGSDNTSMWFVTWGQNDVCHLYPRGTMAGVDHQNKGEQRTLDGSGNPYYIEEHMFRQHIGWTVQDYRNVVRVANIDVSNMQGGSVKLYDLLRKAYYRLHRVWAKDIDAENGQGRTVLYVNRDVMEALDALATNAGSSDNFIRLRTQEIQGEMVTTYRDIPIRVSDALLNTEAVVPAA